MLKPEYTRLVEPLPRKAVNQQSSIGVVGIGGLQLVEEGEGWDEDEKKQRMGSLKIELNRHLAILLIMPIIIITNITITQIPNNKQFKSPSHIFFEQMIAYYHIPQHKSSSSPSQSLTITSQPDLKDAIYSKQILKTKIINMKNSSINDSTLSLLWTISQEMAVQKIDLSQNFSFVTDVGIGHLCQCERMRLKIINLGDNAITDQGLRVLAKAGNMGYLEELRLYGNSDVTDLGLEYLAESEFMGRLRILDFHDTSICDQGMGMFLRAETSANLEEIDLSMNWGRIGNGVLKAISGSKYCTNLKVIKMQDCSVSDEGIGILAESPNSMNIETINLNNSIKSKSNQITDETLFSLAYSKHIKKLKILELRNTEVTAKGLNIMSVSLGSENIQILRLSHCGGIRDDVIKYLECIIGYRSLRKIYLNSTNMSKEGLEGLEGKHRQVSFVY